MEKKVYGKISLYIFAKVMEKIKLKSSAQAIDEEMERLREARAEKIKKIKDKKTETVSDIGKDGKEVAGRDEAEKFLPVKKEESLKPQEFKLQEPGEIPVAEEPAKIEKPEENLDLEKMKQEVDDARRKYIEKDYEADKKAGWLFSILKIGKRNLGKFSEEVDNVKINYEDVLKKYKDAMIEVTVSGGGDFEKVIRYFQITESLNLRIGREDLKMEKHPSWEKWKGIAVGSIDRYRKICAMPGNKLSQWLGKYGYGGKWVGLGAGAVITSTLLAQAGLRSASLPVAVFIGIVSTVGYKKMLETFAESSRTKKDEKEVKTAQKEMEEGNFDMKDRVAKLNEILDKKIGALDERVQKEKAYKRWRTFGAIVLGGATVFGGRKLGELASEKIKVGLGKIQDSEWNQHLSDKIFGMDEQAKSWKDTLIKSHNFGDIHKMSEEASGFKKGAAGTASIHEAIAPNAEISKNIIDIEIEKGDSIEGNIIEKLHGQGIKGVKAENLAHNMALDYAKIHKISFEELNRIQPGDHLEFKIDSEHLENSEIINFERTSGIPAHDTTHIKGATQVAEIHNELHENIAADLENAKVDMAPIEDSGLKINTGIENNSAGVESAPPEINHSADIVMIDGISGTASELENIREIGFNIPKDYEAIQKINVLKFLEEMGKVEAINSSGGDNFVYPNLPHSGFFNRSYIEQGKLASVIKNAIARGIISARENITVSEALRKIKPEDIESLLKMKK
ncbi:MAG TPA: hypothetical protein DCS28_04140 [Candidatus Moranbacteria bacterium]|nr:hypothetical protein [Candidatus Moranbacteria bacterium]HAT75199.1 hypothetical protein [Candidatus Moranbacteria bacterium]